MALSNEQLFALIKKNPIVTVCIVVVLGVAAGIYFRGDLKPQAEIELEDLAKQGRRTSTNIKNSSQLDDQLATMAAANAEIDKRLVRSSELAVNLRHFYELEAETGVKLIDLRQIDSGNARSRDKGQSPKNGSALQPVNFAVAIMGTYPQLIEFLQRLEGGGHFCRIRSASFDPAATEGIGLTLGRPETLNLVLDIELLGTP